MARLPLLALLLVLAACAAPVAPGAPGSPDPSGSPGPAVAADTQGRFVLRFELPRTTWTTTEAITGTATLGTIDGRDAPITASGAGPFGFSFKEIGGKREIGPGFTAGHPFVVEGGRPMTSGIVKSGGYAADDPDAPFYVSFFSEARVHLPAGTWDIGAVAWFVEGECGGPGHDLLATIRVTVTEADR